MNPTPAGGDSSGHASRSTQGQQLKRSKEEHFAPNPHLNHQKRTLEKREYVFKKEQLVTAGGRAFVQFEFKS